MNKVIKYSDDMDTQEIFRLHKEGYELACPKCKSKLTIATSPEEAIEKKIPRGITCPTNPNHVYIVLNFDRKSFWDELKKKWENNKLQHQDKNKGQ